MVNGKPVWLESADFRPLTLLRNLFFRPPLQMIFLLLTLPFFLPMIWWALGWREGVLHFWHHEMTR
jgi:hypothetical protein